MRRALAVIVAPGPRPDRAIGLIPLRTISLVVGLAISLAIGTAAPLAAQPAPREDPLREQTVYVPYEKLGDVFEKEGRGIFLPYARFLELWQKAAGVVSPGTPEGPPPTPIVVSRAAYTGTVADGVVRLEGRLRVEALGDSWAALALPFDGAAVGDVRIEGDGFVLGMVGGRPHVVARKKGGGTLVLDLTLPLVETAGERTVTFRPPPVPAARLELLIPEADARVSVSPALPLETRSAGADATRVTIALGGADGVTLSWRARPKAVAAARPLLFVTSSTRVRVTEGAVSAAATLDYRVLQAPVERIRVALPADADLTAVDGDGIGDWRVAGEGADRTLTIELREKMKGAWRLDLAVERPLASGDDTIAVPSFRDLDARRQDGWVAVTVDPGVKVTVAERDGAHQVDPSDLPPALLAAAPGASGAAPALAFRHLRGAFDLKLRAALVEPRVSATVRTLAVIDDERLVLRSEVALEVERAGLFRVRLALPDGLDVQSVGEGTDLVDDHHVETAESGAGRVLVVRLARKQRGVFTLPVVLERRRAAAETELPLPFPHVLDVERERGVVGVAVLDRFRARTLANEALKPVDVRALPGSPSTWAAPPRTSLVMAWRWEGTEAALTLGLEARDPKVVAAVETRVAVHEDVAKVTAVIRYDVRFAGVERLAFTLPSALDAQVRIEGDALKERTAAPDAASGRTTWTLQLQREIEGEVPIVVSYERPLAGDQASVTLAELVPVGVDRTTGHFAVVKAGNLEIQVAEQAGLEPIDAKELPPDLQGPGIFQAFKYLAHPYTLQLRVTKHAYEPVLQAIADVALLETVVSEERSARTEMALLLQSNQRQYLELTLPDGAEVLTAFVDGEMVRPARREDGTLLLKMPRDASQGDRRFVTRLVYQTRLDDDGMGWFGGLALDAPKLGGVPVSLLLWRVWVPQDYRYFDPGGSMHEVGRDAAGWETGKGHMLALVPDVGEPQWDEPRKDRGTQFKLQGWEDNDATIRAGEGAAAGPLPIQVRLVRQGIARDFSKLDGDGVITFTFVDADVFAIFDLLLFALAAVAVILLGRRGRGRPARRRALLVAAVAGAAIVLSWFTGPTASVLLASVYLGALCAGALWLLLAAAARFRGPDGWWSRVCAGWRNARARFARPATTGTVDGPPSTVDSSAVQDAGAGADATAGSAGVPPASEQAGGLRSQPDPDTVEETDEETDDETR